MLIGVKEIQKVIPHRHPFLPMGYIEELESGVHIVGYKCVTYDESLFKGHLPQEPVMPSILLVETLAQAGAVAILSQEGLRGKVAYFGGIEKAKFERKVVLDNKVKLECEIIKQKGPVGVGRAIAAVDGELAMNTELIFMVG